MKLRKKLIIRIEEDPPEMDEVLTHPVVVDFTVLEKVSMENQRKN